MQCYGPAVFWFHTHTAHAINIWCTMHLNHANVLSYKAAVKETET
jgi:hypothetical protein